MSDRAEIQRALNRASADGWKAFASHRQRVTELLRGSGGPSRLCVLGAGNCNDLDLQTLARSHREVHLVDLDGDAMVAGVQRQGLAGHPAIRLHGGVDVAAVPQRPGAAIAALARDDIARLADAPAGVVPPRLPGPFDVVASTCLLSQLIDWAVRAIGEGNEHFLAAVQAIRCGHFRLLVALTAASGKAVLIADVVSSDTLPALDAAAPGDLATLLGRAVSRGNFFHGSNPALLASLPGADPVLRGQVAAVDVHPPWLWDLGWRRYAVCAMTLRRRQA